MVAIQEKDFAFIEEFIKDSLKERKNNKFRKRAEKIWKEVDRQVHLEEMKRRRKNPTEKSDWRAALELGELSRASEVLSADIRRLTFPTNRSFFDPHANIPPTITEEGPVSDEDEQKRINGRLRAFMVQQQLDFNFKGRVDLSVKEALHHGSYVVEVHNDTALTVAEGDKVNTMSAPVWTPHSMWNCYPDSSQSLVGNNMWYQGSMIITSSIKKYNLKKTEHYFNLDKIPEQGNKNEYELITYFGDISIPRKHEDDIFLPNSKVILANGKIIFYRPNPLKFPEIIYNGWERLDVRDPYFVSPLVKMSPMQKLASILANKTIDSVALHTEPPLMWSSNDPQMVSQGGPITAPGSKNRTDDPNAWSEMRFGDPQTAFGGLQFSLAELQKGTSVDAIRSGIAAGTEQTATEVERTRQGGQIRTVDFVDKHELLGILPFLYLQHEHNKKALKKYPFYNQELDAPDFEIMFQRDLPDEVIFEVTGSKGLIEEQERQARTMAVTQMLYQMAPQMVNLEAIGKELYQDAGNKNPERFLNLGAPEIPIEIEEQLAALTQQTQELQAQNQQLAAELESKQQENEAKFAIEQDKLEIERDKINLEREKIQADSEKEANKQESQEDVKAEEIALERDKLEMEVEERQMKLDFMRDEIELKKQKQKLEMEESQMKAKAASEQLKTSQEITSKVIGELKELKDSIEQPKEIVRDEQGKIIKVGNLSVIRNEQGLMSGLIPNETRT